MKRWVSLAVVGMFLLVGAFPCTEAVADNDASVDKTEISEEMTGQTGSGMEETCEEDDVSGEEYTVAAQTKAALFQTVSSEEKYQRDENGRFDVPNQYVDDITLIGDEKFFGVYSGGEWTTKPMLNYSADSGLRSVEALAQEGRYPEAKEAFLDYYREVASNYPTPSAKSYNYDDMSVTQLLAKNIYYYESKYVGTVSAGNSFEKKSIDIAQTLSYMKSLSNGLMSLYIIAEKKDDSLLEIQGRNVEGMEPTIEIMVNGEKRIFKATASATISAGTNKSTHFTGDTVFARESTSSIAKITGDKLDMNKVKNPPPVDENTRQAIIQFDLSSLPENLDFDSATLSLYVRNSSANGERNLVVFAKDLNWEESTVTWNSFEHSILNFDGEPYIRYNYWSGEKFSTETRTARHRIKYIKNLNSVYRFYSDSDDKEEVAGILITQLCGLLDYMANQSKMTGADGATTEFRNNLDIGDSAARLEEFIPFIGSTLITPEFFTAFMKLVYRWADFLEKNYDAGNNWGAIETDGFYKINLYFPFFDRTEHWMQVVASRSYNANLLAPDGSCLEGSVGYTSTAFSRYFYMLQNAVLYGKENPLPEETMEQIVKGMKYRSMISLPGFKDPQLGDAALETSLVRPSAEYGKLLDSPELLWFSDSKSGVKPVFTSHSYPIGSHEYIMRTGWESKDMYGYINMRRGWSSHTHADDMQFIFSAYGKYLLTDPSYMGDNSKAEGAAWVKTNEAHNTVIVDNKNQLSKIGNYNNNTNIEYNWNTNGAYDYFRGRSDANANAYHTRGVLFIRGKYVIVNDYMTPRTSGNHSYRQLWHMRPDANLYIDENNMAFRSDFDDVNVQVVPVNADTYDNVLIKNGYYRGTGGSSQKADYGSFEKSGNGNVSFETVIVPENANQDITVRTSKIEISGIAGEDAASMEISIDDAADASKSLTAVYYALNDTSRTAKVRVGDYSFNGTMSYVERDAQGNLSAVYVQDETNQAGGIELKDEENDRILFRSTVPTPALAVEYGNKNVYLYSKNNVDPMENTLTYDAPDLEHMSFYVPDKMSKVYLNGEEIAFQQDNNYIYFGERIIDAPEFVGPVKPSSGNDSGTPAHGGGGGEGSQGGSPAVPSDPVTPPTTDEKTPYEEELEQHWGKDEIMGLIEKGIVQGDGSTLNLSASVRRSEFISMLVRSLELDAKKPYTLDLEDVSAEDWFAGAVQTALENGIILADGDSVRPNDFITREEMAVMVMRCRRLSGGTNETENLFDFTDKAQISSWALDDVTACRNAGYIEGFPDGAFRPKENALREQAMVIISRFVKDGK